jgi:hypothetical protein
MKWPIQIANTGKVLILLLPFYYLIFYPIAFILNIIDVNTTHKSGTGLIVTAIK